jgi:hypothetical protein
MAPAIGASTIGSSILKRSMRRRSGHIATPPCQKTIDEDANAAGLSRQVHAARRTSAVRVAADTLRVPRRVGNIGGRRMWAGRPGYDEQTF